MRKVVPHKVEVLYEGLTVDTWASADYGYLRFRGMASGIAEGDDDVPIHLILSTYTGIPKLLAALDRLKEGESSGSL